MRLWAVWRCVRILYSAFLLAVVELDSFGALLSG